ncbi:MAG: hypothetical protein ACE14S_08440 [Candidatus Bathyarchaeia archaeon]
MFRNREEIRRILLEVVEKFRQKGATSPEKALSAQELGLPPRFEDAMHRRLGRTGIFVEINGRYYLNEERLKQLQESRDTSKPAGAGGGGGGEWSPRKTLSALRLARFAITLVLILLVIASLYVQSWELIAASIGFFAFWIVLFIVTIYYRSKVRKGLSSLGSSWR